MKASPFRWPDSSHRIQIVGRTGSGKSVMGMHVLSLQNFDEQPWIITDYKNEELINSIDRIKEIGLNEVPRHPGLYKVKPHPKDDEGVDAFLTRVWERENVGLFFDEGHMLPDKDGLAAVYTQGRSKHIPCITCSQRPVWLSKFAFSQADFISAFHLNDAKDELTVQGYMPRGSLKKKLPEHWSRWYDVGKDALFTMQPVPAPDVIAEKISERLKPKHKIY